MRSVIFALIALLVAAPAHAGKTAGTPGSPALVQIAQGGPPGDKRREIQEKLEEERRAREAEARRKREAEARRRAEAERRKRAAEARRRQAQERARRAAERRRRQAEEARRRARRGGSAASMAALRGYSALVRTRTRSPSRDFCGLLRRAGMRVHCGIGEDVTGGIGHFIMVNCSRMPSNAGKIIKAYLRLPARHKVHNMRAPTKCGKGDDVTVYVGQ